MNNNPELCAIMNRNKGLWTSIRYDPEKSKVDLSPPSSLPPTSLPQSLALCKLHFSSQTRAMRHPLPFLPTSQAALPQALPSSHPLHPPLKHNMRERNIPQSPGTPSHKLHSQAPKCEKGRCGGEAYREETRVGSPAGGSRDTVDRPLGRTEGSTHPALPCE